VNNAAAPLITSLPLSGLNPYTESFEVVSNNENYDSDPNQFLSVTPQQGNVQKTVQQGYGENEKLPNSQENGEMEYDGNDNQDNFQQVYGVGKLPGTQGKNQYGYGENGILPDSQENFQHVNGAGKLPGSQGKNQLGYGENGILHNSQENVQQVNGSVQFPSIQEVFTPKYGSNGHLPSNQWDDRDSKNSTSLVFHTGTFCCDCCRCDCCCGC
jgi:hypothetical protein